MNWTRLAVVAIVASVAAGCVSKGAPSSSSPTASPTQSPGANMTYPPPFVAYSKEINACPQTTVPPYIDSPQGTTFPEQKFKIGAGYDQMIIEFHVSGQGNADFQVKDSKGTLVFGNDDKHPVTQVACGTHSHTDNPTNKTVTPGDYSVTFSYSGVIGIHASVTVRNSHSAMAGMMHNHTAAPAP